MIIRECFCDTRRGCHDPRALICPKAPRRMYREHSEATMIRGDRKDAQIMYERSRYQAQRELLYRPREQFCQTR